MNRRDFIKTALAGLAALVLPKGKVPEPERTWVSSGWIDVHGPHKHRFLCGEPGPEIISVPNNWSLCNADGECIGGRDSRIEWGSLEIHNHIGPLFITDDQLGDNIIYK